MEIRSQDTLIQLIDEPVYSTGSSDNIRRYGSEVTLDEGKYHPTSKHGVVIDGDPVVVFLAGGGCSAVHEHSAIVLDHILYLAVVDQVVSMEIGSRHVKWALSVDTATCFGVYYSIERDALLSHGELEITRFTRDGHVMWSSSGADIFTEGFDLKPDWVEAIDFNGKNYHFDYDTGDEIRP